MSFVASVTGVRKGEFWRTDNIAPSPLDGHRTNPASRRRETPSHTGPAPERQAGLRADLGRLAAQIGDEAVKAYYRDHFRARLDQLFGAGPGARGQRGYTGLLVEVAAGRRTADWKEHLNWGEAAPDGTGLGERFADQYLAPVFPEAECPGISQRLMAFHRRVADLQRRFLRIVALGLGAPADHFDRMTQHGVHLTRAVHYPAMAEAPAYAAGSGEPHVWAAEHGDINLVTALPRATAPGLQVRTADGWLDVEPPPGHAVLNSGMMLERVSNGLIPAGLHRVVAAPDQVGDRLAVVQFCHPTPDTLLAPMSSCVSRSRPAAYEPIPAAEWLSQVLRTIGLDT